MSQSPDVQARRPGADLAEHLSLLRRRWLLFVGCIVFGGTAGLALMRLTPSAYTATTQVQVMPVGPQEPGNPVTPRQREPLNLDTEAQVARSAVVAARAAKTLGVEAPAPVEVSVPPNSAVLWISVTAAGPAVAAAQSQAYAEAYLAYRRESALAALSAQQQAVLSKLRQVNAALDKAIRELDRLSKGTPEQAIALQRRSVLGRQAAGLALKYDALRTVAVTPGAIISKAVPPAAPSSPSLPLYLGTGLMAGLLAGSAAAYARDRLDTRLRTAADVERLTGLPVLADLSGPGQPDMLHGLARADAALLLVGLGRVTTQQVEAAARHLSRHDVPIIGVVTASAAAPSFVPLPDQHPHTPLGKLVATGELGVSAPAETTPMQTLHQPPSGRPT